MARAIDTEDQTQGEHGPAMLALANDRQRNFVVQLFNAPQKRGRLLWAALASGYGTPTSSRKSLGVIASRLAMDERVQTAIAEESRKRMRVLAPAAVSALERLLDRPGHKDHARALAMVLDRADPVETTHNVKVEHTRPVTVQMTAAVIEKITQLAIRAGLEPQKMLPVIDGEFTEVAAPADGDASCAHP